MVAFMVHKNAVNLNRRKHDLEGTPVVTNALNNNRIIIKKFINIKKWKTVRKS
jgi:hypothetical protein